MPIAERRDAAAQSAGATSAAEFDEAIGKLRDRLLENPDDPLGWTLLARSLAALERNGEAVPAYRRALEAWPLSQEALLGVAEFSTLTLVFGLLAGSALVAAVARVGGSISDLTTRLAGPLYVVMAEIDLPPTADAESLRQAVRAVAADLGVEASLRAGEADDL